MAKTVLDADGVTSLSTSGPVSAASPVIKFAGHTAKPVIQSGVGIDTRN